MLQLSLISLIFGTPEEYDSAALRAVIDSYAAASVRVKKSSIFQSQLY